MVEETKAGLSGLLGEEHDRMLKRILLVYWVICSLGLIGILYGASRQFKLTSFLKIQAVDFNDWALPWLFPAKPQELMFEGGAWIGLLVFYLIIGLALANSKWLFRSMFSIEDRFDLRAGAVFGALALALNGLIFAWFRAKNNAVVSVTSLILVLLWIVVTVILPFSFSVLMSGLPSFPGRIPHVLKRGNEFARSRSITALIVSLLGLICVHFVIIFIPFVREDLKVINEFFDIPGYTVLENGLVYNTAFINEHRFAGFNKYDPVRDLGRTPTPPQGMYIQLPKNDHLESFIHDHPTDYYYNDDLHSLVINRAMTSDEYLSLSFIYPAVDLKENLETLYRASAREYERLRNKTSTAEEKEFFKKNKFEIQNQILNRWVIHHHNFVLGPINEYSKGKSLDHINAQYGLLNVVIMANLLEWAGGVSYNNYFRIWYSFWLIYFALFVGCCLLIFRNVHYVALVCLLAFGYIMKIDYLMLSLGPGLNPIRHFFDIPLLAGLCMFVRTRRLAFIVIASIAALLGVLNNFQFGLALAMALGATLMIMALVERRTESRPRRTFLGLLGVFLVCAPFGLALAPSLGKNSMLTYYLSGFVGPPFSIDRLVLTMLAVSVGYACLLYFEDASKDLKYLGLCLLLYSQALFFYYTWGNTPPHILNLAPLLILCVVVFIKLILDSGPWGGYQRMICSVLLLVAFCFVYVPGCYAYYSAKETFDNNFTDHKVFEWNLKRAHLTSTMDPQPFIDSISLIKEISGESPSVHILSKYDNFIPFLADKYSAMPFSDLSWFLITTKETNVCIDYLRSEKPPYLFVDTDIERNLNGDVITAEFSSEENYNVELAKESRRRVLRLNLLKQIFSSIKNDYEPVKRGILLTAYKRKV